MFATERQDRIYKLICESDAVSTSALVKLFDVSIETIRRDLLEMEKKKLLKRVHGGAIKIGRMGPLFNLEERHKSNSEQKAALARAAAELVNEGDYIALDCGSTALVFAEALRDRFSKLTVVTHSLEVFQMLCEHRDFEVILCSGHYLKEEHAFHGALTASAYDRLHVEKGFICPAALSLDCGIFDCREDTCMMQQKILEISDSVFILADSSKFEKRALIKLSPMRSDYTYVTDGELKNELKELYFENGINVIKG